jgi:ABC-type amino acid transport substrate-binding protein
MLWPFAANSIVVGTYSAPPFSMNEDGENIGLATEAIQDLLAKSGVTDYSIVYYPLTRGLVELKNGRIDIFYPYMHNQEASKEQYDLIGPISKYKVSFFVRKEYPAGVSLPALRNSTVGAERGSLADAFLLQQNMHVEQTTEKISCLRMVLADRVSACALGTLPGMYDSAINNIYDKIRFVETNLAADMYLALGPSLPAATVTAIKGTFAKLQDEKYFEIKQKDYETKFNIFIESMK